MFSKKTYTEQELINLCATNDRLAQEALYKRYFSDMWAMCRKNISDEEMVMDIINTSFLKVFKAIVKFEAKGSLEGWIRRIVYNTMIDFVRKNNKYVRFLILEDHDTNKQ